jgi:hypothetical protein
MDAIVSAISIVKPDLVVLGGDYAEGEDGVGILRRLTGVLAPECPVIAIAGNHDYRMGVDRIRRVLEDEGARWIEGGSGQVELHSNQIYLYGNTIPANIEDGEFSILCAHNPKLFSAPGAHKFKLGFAGHLHGCQWVLWQKDGILYPGAWFYAWNGLRFDYPDRCFLVGRGLGDTLPLRFRCPHEILVAELDNYGPE